MHGTGGLMDEAGVAETTIPHEQPTGKPQTLPNPLASCGRIRLAQLTIGRNGLPAPPAGSLVILLNIARPTVLGIQQSRATLTQAVPREGIVVLGADAIVLGSPGYGGQFLALSVPRGEIDRWRTSVSDQGSLAAVAAPPRLHLDKLAVQLLQRIAATLDRTGDDRAVRPAVWTLLGLLQGLMLPAAYPGREAKRLSGEQLVRLQIFVDARIDERLSLNQLARHLGMSRFTFGRRFRMTCGISPYQWLIRRRLDHAGRLLRSTTLPVATIAYTVGFSSQSHLTSTFSRFHGMTPAALRRTGLCPETME